jgi:peptidoglycan/xylan/chitin deacetylase (PgdA/CDA1 family)
MSETVAENGKRLLAFRFDVDSVRCLEEGVPRLSELGTALGVRFSFFVNMGYSFNWSHNFRHFVAKRLDRTRAPSPPRAPSLPTRTKLGTIGVLKTMFLNPRLGDRYKAILDSLHAAGHELGLHGGSDHVIWQRSLGQLSKAGIDALLRPAYDDFTARYGRPRGFACPGFVHNAHVYELLDSYGFAYSSDESGEEPFRPSRGGVQYSHFQVPVNVMGEAKVPLVEQMLAMGKYDASIVSACACAIRDRPFALMYGHPYVEGVRADILQRVIEAVDASHEVVTVAEYFERWCQTNAR